MILSSVACPALLLFSTFSLKPHNFPRKNTEYKMCVLIFYKTETFYILRRIQPDIITNLKKLEFFQKKILKYQSSWKSVQWEPRCYMRTDREPDMTKPTAAFRNLANKPKKKSNSHNPLPRLRHNIRLPAWNKLSRGMSAEDSFRNNTLKLSIITSHDIPSWSLFIIIHPYSLPLVTLKHQ